ncbi:MAG TPA: cytochrome D1 domain-containing protein [Chloroflexota bacterium]|nr:cytochrome D1 domain-containing protein [Chloroflexota bacterium]
MLGGGRWVLDGGLDRRTLLKGASGAALTALVAACAPGGAGAPTPTGSAANPTSGAAAPAPTRPPTPGATPGGAAAATPGGQALVTAVPTGGASAETVYVFNVGSKDVTLIDAAARQPRETRPLGAAVRWLSNEQTYYDGQLIWTYDFPDNKLQAIGIDPRTVTVTKTIPELGTGPGHSLMLLPDKKTAAINVAGDNVIAVVDVASSQIIRKVPTGKFPCDLHYTPDGRFAYTPERDQDTVSMYDARTWELLKTVSFPQGSQPYMLRVSHDGKEVWVQTGKVDTNVVLSADDLSTIATLPTGKGPVTNSWTPDGRYSVVSNSSDTFASVFDAKTYKEVARLAVGQGASNIGFTRDGATGFMSVTGANAVAVIDMGKLTVVTQLKAGTQPQGLIVF